MLFRTIKITLIIVFLIVAVLFSSYMAYQYTHEDVSPPAFVMDSDYIEVSVDATNDELCAGLYAYDNMDGDVSNKITVYKISQLISKDEATITYVVFDNAANHSTCSRTIRYTDYQKPHFSISEPLVFRVGDTIRLDSVSAYDVLDGDITNRVTYDASIATITPGYFPMLMRVINSAGDAATLTVTVIVEEGSAARPTIRLTDYLIYVQAGDTVNYMSYVKSIKDPHVPDHIPVTDIKYNADNVDLSTPGTYEVYYYYTGVSGDMSTVILTVVVE